MCACVCDLFPRLAIRELQILEQLRHDEVDGLLAWHGVQVWLRRHLVWAIRGIEQR